MGAEPKETSPGHDRQPLVLARQVEEVTDDAERQTLVSVGQVDRKATARSKVDDIIVLEPLAGHFDVATLTGLATGLSPGFVEDETRGVLVPRPGWGSLHQPYLCITSAEITLDLSCWDGGDDGMAMRAFAAAVLKRYRCRARAHRETTDHCDPVLRSETKVWTGPVVIDDLFPPGEHCISGCCVQLPS